MDFDAIDYYFDDVTSFHAELDDILRYPCSDEQDVKRTATRYIRFVVRFQAHNSAIDDFCSAPHEIAQVAYKLIDSRMFLEHSTTILSHILHSHALATSDPHDLRVAYSLLVHAGREDARWMRYIVSDARHKKQNRLFQKIMREIESSLGGHKLMEVSVVLGYEMCKVSKLKAPDLASIFPSFINLLFDTVESTVSDEDETFNYDIIRLVLVLNEQFMMAPVIDKQSQQPNVVLNVLKERIGTTNTFSANLIFMLNRSDDACTKLLILKLLYGIFTHPKLYEYFYTNDLYVLVDIILREMCNLGEEEREAVALRDAYLRVLRPLLVNTQLRQTPYKQHEIHSLLSAMITPCSYKTVDPTTLSLVKRILH